jgi:hypothetical protein
MNLNLEHQDIGMSMDEFTRVYIKPSVEREAKLLDDWILAYWTDKCKSV